MGGCRRQRHRFGFEGRKHFGNQIFGIVVGWIGFAFTISTIVTDQSAMQKLYKIKCLLYTADK